MRLEVQNSSRFFLGDLSFFSVFLCFFVKILANHSILNYNGENEKRRTDMKTDVEKLFEEL